MDDVERSGPNVQGSSSKVACGRARGRITMLESTARLVASNALKKGDVLAAARFAGVQAAKGAPHYLTQLPMGLRTEVSIDFDMGEHEVLVRVAVQGDDSLGAALVALTGVTAACLTIFDMCKAVDRTMAIGPVQIDTPL